MHHKLKIKLKEYILHLKTGRFTSCLLSEGFKDFSALSFSTNLTLEEGIVDISIGKEMDKDFNLAGQIQSTDFSGTFDIL